MATASRKSRIPFETENGWNVTKRGGDGADWTEADDETNTFTQQASSSYNFYRLVNGWTNDGSLTTQQFGDHHIIEYEKVSFLALFFPFISVKQRNTKQISFIIFKMCTPHNAHPSQNKDRCYWEWRLKNLLQSKSSRFKSSPLSQLSSWSHHRPQAGWVTSVASGCRRLAAVGGSWSALMMRVRRPLLREIQCCTWISILELPCSFARQNVPHLTCTALHAH